jgi:hypothetical protein
MIGTPGRTDDCKLGRMLSSLSRQRMRLLDCSGNVGLLDGKIADKVRGKDRMWVDMHMPPAHSDPGNPRTGTEYSDRLDLAFGLTQDSLRFLYNVSVSALTCHFMTSR